MVVVTVTMNSKLLSEWAQKTIADGKSPEMQIMIMANCSSSLAGKILGNTKDNPARKQHIPGPQTRKLLADGMGLREDELFPKHTGISAAA